MFLKGHKSALTLRGKYELFWLSGTFWKGQSLYQLTEWQALCYWVYWAGAVTPEPTGTEQLSWCGEWVERLMAVNLTPSCTLRLSVDALERASLEPKIPRNQKMPPEREQTSKAGGSGYLSFHLELEHIFVSYGCHCGGQPRVAIPNHNPWLGSKVVPKALPGPMSVMLCLMN